MKYDSLDKIVRRALLDTGCSIHWYFYFYHNAVECLRELNLDILRNVKAVLLPVDQNIFTAKLPCDYIDYVRIGYTFGQEIVPMSYKDSLNRLPNLNAQGQPIPWPNTQPTDGTNQFPFALVDFFSYGYYYWYLNNYNSYGENLGGYYGYTGTQSQSFKVIEERGIIQLDQNSGVQTLYMEYISDGFDTQNCTCSTLVSYYAIDAIKAYIQLRQAMFYTRNKQQIPLFQRNYDLAVRRLIARKNPISNDDIRASFRKGYMNSPKPF